MFNYLILSFLCVSFLYGIEVTSPYDEHESVGDKETRTDQEIQERVRSKIDAVRFQKAYDGVSVDVDEGKLEVKGQVKNARDQRKLNEVLQTIEGVKQVEDDTQIEPKPGSHL